jgi:type I restriction enzyme S subunit
MVTAPQKDKEASMESLPDGWKAVPLDEMADLVGEKTDPSDARGMPYVGLEHIDSGRPRLTRVGNPEDVRSTKGVFREQDVLYGKLRPYLNKAVLAPCSGICSTDILILRAKAESCDPRFLAFALHCYPFLQHAINTTTGTNHPRTSWAKIGSFRFMLPPLPEQRKIAAVLGVVQEAKERTEAVIQAAKELKKSLLKYLFTYGPVPVDEAENVPLKETEVGAMPEAWEVRPLGELGSFRYGFTASAQDHDTGMRFLRITDIRDDGVVNWPSVPFAEVPEDERSKYALRNGDLLFARIGATTGKTCVIANDRPDAVFASYLIRFQAHDDLNPSYTFYFTQTESYWQQVRAGMGGKLKKGLSAGQLKDFIVQVPPAAHQDRIASIVRVVDGLIAVEEDRRGALGDMFSSLLHNLMTARVRVNDLELPAGLLEDAAL